jgi:FSR family fosmidomycin resistance protein-like MFS transporter
VRPSTTARAPGGGGGTLRCRARAPDGLPEAAFGVAVFFVFLLDHGALSAIQSFAEPGACSACTAAVDATAFVVTGYMLCGAAGMVIGGFVVARAERLERLIAAGDDGWLAAAAGVGCTGWLPPLLCAAAVALAGSGPGWRGRRATC